ncbi:MAG: hypothetical protein IPM97_13545 [Bdellovibrionaceae bacterium]|nr:hypothetical protein [Pseudobdellovibrionaceae bacterium]
MRSLSLVLLFLVASIQVDARVFDINTEKFASYFVLTGGSSALNQAAFLDESNVAYSYDKQVSYNYAGEFGFLFATSAVGLRFGFEVFKPQLLTEINATNSGTTVYTLKSEYTGYAPKLGIELNVHKSPSSRVFLLGYAGTASVSYKNDYADHTEEGKGTKTLYGGSIGYEGFLTDTTTYMFDVGYRELNFDKINYAKDVALGIDGQAHTAGTPVLDMNGQQRTLNFTGVYFGIGFRFYL